MMQPIEIHIETLLRRYPVLTSAAPAIREATGIEPTGKLAEIMQAQEGAPA